MAGPIIELKDVVKRYGALTAVDGLSLAIEPGTFTALLGGSGSGKTTALKTINGLIIPDGGQVSIDGRAAGDEAGWALRRRIGYVFQEIGLFPHMTVAENIAIGPRLAGWDKPTIAALSGGQRQRVGVARALAAKPAIMLMDEPFGALDPVTRDALGRDYRALHERLGLTTVMVTHDVWEALLLADRIVVMDHGKMLADATPSALLAGHGDERVQALMATPRRQADRVRALAGGAL